LILSNISSTTHEGSYLTKDYLRSLSHSSSLFYKLQDIIIIIIAVFAATTLNATSLPVPTSILNQ